MKNKEIYNKKTKLKDVPVGFYFTWSSSNSTKYFKSSKTTIDAFGTVHCTQEIFPTNYERFVYPVPPPLNIRKIRG